jgi:hypothetical protein
MTVEELVSDMETSESYFEVPPDDAHRIAKYIRFLEDTLSDEDYDLGTLRTCFERIR